MNYSDDTLRELAKEYAAVGTKRDTLLALYTQLNLKEKRAQEFAHQGFSRRLKVLAKCIGNTFDSIPPHRTEHPSDDELIDATINIQCFVFNVFGAIDNLAWIWVSETGQKRTDGASIPNIHVGLGPDNTAVRSTLSQELQNYLQRLDPWFRHLGGLRHALAHRIPLYIPPYSVEEKDEAAYRDLESKMDNALKKGDSEEYERLSNEQRRLFHFRPWVLHSFVENTRPVVFHAQMLADFYTVDELAHKMLMEFARLRAG